MVHGADPNIERGVVGVSTGGPGILDESKGGPGVGGKGTHVSGAGELNE
jgi:hypothetical protein